MLLEVQDLRTHLRSPEGLVKAVDGISFSLDRAETLGLVGESGSGKSMASLTLMRLLPSAALPPRGQVRLAGVEQELLGADERVLASLRGNRMAMIFQDPMTALNPYLTVGRQLGEGLRHHQGVRGAALERRMIDALAEVGLPDPQQRLRAYPHELSGGMRQRVLIAMALITGPSLLIADEPTTALDVTIQAQILRLLADLQRRHGTAILFISHDLGVVARVADRVAVMYAGRIVESAPTAHLFARPAHPYTRGLLGSLPRLDGPRGRPLDPIPGRPPDLAALPPGCPFAPRCALARERCLEAIPPLVPLAGHEPEHQVACWEATP